MLDWGVLYIARTSISISFVVLLLLSLVASQTRDRIQITKTVSAPAMKGDCPFSYASVFERDRPEDLAGFFMSGWRALIGRQLVVIPHYECPPIIKEVTFRLQRDSSTFSDETSMTVFEGTPQLEVTVSASDREGNPLLYQYTVSGGVIRGSGNKVIWDLSGISIGSHRLKVCVDEGYGFDVCAEKEIELK